MKFLVNAHLPRRLIFLLNAAGHDAIHTLDLPERNRTPDLTINQVSVREQRILITKDGEFKDSFLLEGRPYKLLLISTGNITNADLERLLRDNLEEIVRAFQEHSFLELDRATLTIHS